MSDPVHNTPRKKERKVKDGTSKVLKSASRSKDSLCSIQSRARRYSALSPMRSIVSSTSTTVWPIPPVAATLEPFWLIGWYASAPIASLSVFISEPRSYTSA